MNIDFEDDRIPQRVWDKIYPEPMSGCWIWSAAQANFGYGVTGVGRASEGTIRVHIWMALINLGPKPFDSARVLHSCDIPWCVNPDHLSYGTASDNSAQMVKRGRSSRKNYCLNQHELTEDNRYSYGACIRCARDRALKNRRNKSD